MSEARQFDSDQEAAAWLADQSPGPRVRQADTARERLLNFALAAFKEDPNPMVSAHANKLVDAVEEAVRKAEHERVRAAVTEGAPLGRALTVSEVLEQHEVTRKALADALGPQLYHLNWAQLLEAARRSGQANVEWQREVNELQADRDRLAARLDEYRASRERWMKSAYADRHDSLAAHAAIARVRALHQPLERTGSTCCAHCSGWDGKFRCRGIVTPWPCPTLQAIDGAGEGT